MRNFTTFLGKEFIESIRTKKLLVLGLVFVSFAITSPLLARFMGEFFALLMPADDETAQIFVEAFSNPVWQESYIHLYSNLSQIGIFALLFMYMATVSREIRTGTASLMFSKGLGYGEFVLAKFVMGCIIVVLITIASVLVAYMYTFLLFDEAGNIGHIILGSLIFSLGAVTALGYTIMFSSLTKSTGASAGMSFGLYFGLALLGGIPVIGPYIPSNLLSGYAISVSFGDFSRYMVINAGIATAFIALCLLISSRALMRAEG